MSKTLLVTSGKGGTGKTTISQLLGKAIASFSKNVLIIELDSGLRGLDLMLSVSDKVVYDLSDVLHGSCKPIKAITVVPTQTGNLHLIAAPTDRKFKLSRRPLEQLLEGLSECYDFIIFDTAAGLGTAFDVASTFCDTALIVATCDMVSLRDACVTVKVLPHINCRLVLNKFKSTQLKGTIEYIDTAIDIVKAQLISVIPYDENIILWGSNGYNQQKSSVLVEIDDLARRLMGEDIPLNQKRIK